MPSSSARANSIMSPGRISGIPPTRVETTNRPAEAASIVLIPKASVRDVLRYICPLLSTYDSKSVRVSSSRPLVILGMRMKAQTYRLDIMWPDATQQSDPVL